MGDALAAAKRHIEAFNAHNIEAHLANDAPDIEWVQPGATANGREAVRRLQEALWEALPDARITPVTQIENEDVAITEATLEGTHTGVLRSPAGDVPPTGNKLAMPFVTVQRVRHGLVASEHLYFDQLEFSSQLCLIPARA
jgi:steroid delta-isomerase-like uncharacterized protein